MDSVKFHHNTWNWGESWKVVINEGDCLGEVSIQSESPEECFVSGISTIPEARRKGLASFFLKIAEGIAAEHHCKYMALYVEKEQKENIAFYKKRGYVRHAEDGPWYEMRKTIE